MIRNIGTTEKYIRIGLGIILLLVGYFAGLPQWGSIIAYVLGAVAIVTGAINYCPISQVLGINTSEAKTPKKA